MRSPFWKKLVLAMTASTLVIAAVSLNSIGQDTKKADPKAKAGARDKSKGRLPSYYKDVVTDEQREKIYTIQAKYEKQLADLEGQLDAVRAQQNAEIEKLLSTEQKEKLAKARAEAEARRKGRRGDNAAKTPEPEKTK